MLNSRENILLTALRLFSQNGYEAVSISDIAGALGLSKGAMYRHFKNKRDLFNQILLRMEEDDAQRAQAFSLPEEDKSVSPEKYAAASLERVLAFAEAQFAYWTADAFACPFRRMISLERYRSAEMGALYQNYLGAGPLNYTIDLFSSLNVPDSRGSAGAGRVSSQIHGRIFMAEGGVFQLFDAHGGLFDGAAFELYAGGTDGGDGADVRRRVARIDWRRRKDHDAVRAFAGT